MDPAWDELLDALDTRLGMYALPPRLLTASALLEGFSRGRDDGVARGFREWMGRQYPSEGGHPNPVAHEVVLAEALFQKRPQDLDYDEERIAVSRLVELMRQYLQQEDE